MHAMKKIARRYHTRNMMIYGRNKKRFAMTLSQHWLLFKTLKWFHFVSPLSGYVVLKGSNAVSLHLLQKKKRKKKSFSCKQKKVFQLEICSQIFMYLTSYENIKLSSNGFMQRMSAKGWYWVFHKYPLNEANNFTEY